MNIKINPWIVQNIIIGKLFQLIVLTWIFTFLFRTTTDKGLTYFLNRNNETIFTQNYSLGYLGLVYIIPAALISIWIIKLVLRLTSKFLHTPLAEKLAFLARKLKPMADKLGISKFLYIDKVDSGKWYSSFLLPLKIATLLIKILVVSIVALSSLAFKMIIFIVDKFSPTSRGGVSSSHSGGVSNRGNNRDKLKSDAEWQARQKQKDADYALRQAVKQGQYNANTHYFDEKVNRANALQHKANESTKKARNL